MLFSAKVSLHEENGLSTKQLIYVFNASNKIEARATAWNDMVCGTYRTIGIFVGEVNPLMYG